MNAITIAVWMLLSTVVSADEQYDSAVLRQQVDLIELNHFIDENGREVFKQVIFYDWSKTHRRFHVRAWRLIKSPDQLPVRSFQPRRYTCTWNEDELRKEVWAPSMRETWSQEDPERKNRKHLAEDRRIPLWTSRKR